MFDHQKQPYLISAAGPILNGQPNWEVEVVKMADQLFREFRLRGRLRRLWRRLAGHPVRLLDLNDVQPGQVTGANEEPGVVSVPIHQIRGSEGRSRDFDAGFAPLKSHHRERWSSVAAQRLLGEQLPAVELVRVGSDYYIRDGHHRVSVAQALGQKSIDARVIVWRLAAESRAAEADSPVSKLAFR